jgi:hypothetical protein
VAVVVRSRWLRCRGSDGCDSIVGRSPRFSAFTIGSSRVCGGTVGTVNIGSRAPACPLLMLRCTRGGPLSYKTSAPDQDADRIGFLIQRSHS